MSRGRRALVVVAGLSISFWGCGGGASPPAVDAGAGHAGGGAAGNAAAGQAGTAGAAGGGGQTSASTGGAGGGANGGSGGVATGGTAGGGAGGAPTSTLSALAIAPASGSVALQRGTAPGALTGTAAFTATGHYADGSSGDLTTAVVWKVQPSTGTTFTGATATFIAPGTYTITASSGAVSSNPATIHATFTGDFVCTDLDTSGACAAFDATKKAALQGTPAGTLAIAYPLAGALFPSNLGPIQVQLAAAGTAGRVRFQTPASQNLTIDYYGSCEPAPGTGCAITIPLALTQLLPASSDNEDVQIVGRVLSASGALSESSPLTVNWAAAPLTGSLTFWANIPNPPVSPTGTPTPPNYVELDRYLTDGVAVKASDFSKGNLPPVVLWTDDGGPGSTPPFEGAPQAWDNAVAGGHCIGCHALSNDGKYMALTIGGSAIENAANWALLDLAKEAFLLINPPPGVDTSSDPAATPTSDAGNYWLGYRKEGLAVETAWGPNDDVMVNMFQAKLYQTSVAISGTSATVTRQGPVFPISAPDPYAADPFWSADGSLFAFTSFNQVPANGMSGTPLAPNGDLRMGGQIALAPATAEAVSDAAQVLVPRTTGVNNYYPAISSDSAYLVYDTSSCGSGSGTEMLGGSYGTGTCDGYDDSTAQLWWIPTKGGTSTLLANANGPGAVDNSFPRFAPTVGTFRGKPLYWIVFSSRRAYGVQVNAGVAIGSTQPQIWFAGIAPAATADPSFAPVWLPGQNAVQLAPTDNHTPQWSSGPLGGN